MLDLDQFKSVNDRFGHAVGDAMLAVVGRTIMRTLRGSDIRVRWGGEEFLVALPETDFPRAQVVANGLLREISAATVATVERPSASTVSIGITISRQGETDTAAMIRRADTALYHAKAAGRACVRVMLRATAQARSLSVATAAAGICRHRSDIAVFRARRSPQRIDRPRVPSSGRRRIEPIRETGREKRHAGDGSAGCDGEDSQESLVRGGYRALSGIPCGVRRRRRPQSQPFPM